MRDLQVHLDDGEHIAVHLMQDGKPVTIYIGQQECVMVDNGAAMISIGINTSDLLHNDETQLKIAHRQVMITRLPLSRCREELSN